MCLTISSYNKSTRYSLAGILIWFLLGEEVTLGISHDFVSESEIQSSEFYDLGINVFGSRRETRLNCVSGKSGNSFSSAAAVNGNLREKCISAHISWIAGVSGVTFLQQL